MSFDVMRGKRRGPMGMAVLTVFGLLSGLPAFPDTSPAEIGLLRFIRAYSADLPSGMTTSYGRAFVDLNGDGKDEVIAYLLGRGWCGSGGCTLLVLEPEGSGYRLVTSVPIAQLPIRILATKTNGWRDLGVFVQGGGIQPGYEARLRFEKGSDPRNPSVHPAEPLEAKVDGQVLISNTTVWSELE